MIPLPHRIPFPVWCPPILQPVLQSLLQPFSARLAVMLQDEPTGFTDVPALLADPQAAGLILYTPLATALTEARGDLAGAAAAWQARMQALPDLAAARPALLVAEAEVLATAAPGLQRLVGARNGIPMAGAGTLSGLPATSPLAGLMAAAVAQTLPGLAGLLARLAAANSPVPGHCPAACDPATLQALLSEAGQMQAGLAIPAVLDRAFRVQQAHAMDISTELAARNAAIVAMAQDIARRDAEMRQAAARAAASEAEVLALHTSHSWRVTAPLRAASLLVRRLRSKSA